MYQRLRVAHRFGLAPRATLDLTSRELLRATLYLDLEDEDDWHRRKVQYDLLSLIAYLLHDLRDRVGVWVKSYRPTHTVDDFLVKLAGEATAPAPQAAPPPRPPRGYILPREYHEMIIQRARDEGATEEDFERAKKQVSDWGRAAVGMWLGAPIPE